VKRGVGTPLRGLIILRFLFVFCSFYDHCSVKGFVPTPAFVVDLMVGKLFAERAPSLDSTLLDPGCGNGEFIEGVLRACTSSNWPLPRIVGIEIDPSRAAEAAKKFAGIPQIEIRHADFLHPQREKYEYILGNPPYVSILELSPVERLAYRSGYRTARGRFDLYVLFFEQALRTVTVGGRIVFITPEKFVYVQTAGPLRELLQQHHIHELDFLCESTFPDRVTYPLVSTVVSSTKKSTTRIIRRDGTKRHVLLSGSQSWQAAVEGYAPLSSQITLADVSLRVSCGVATGADSVFIVPFGDVSRALQPFAHPTVSGRQILPTQELDLKSVMLAPYDENGQLLPEHELASLGVFLRREDRLSKLAARTCVAHKPWYAFHDNFPLHDLLRPKLLCKDITESPFFVVDASGKLVPRHSVYYVVPADVDALEPLAAYLNSTIASDWLRAHCQRAANNFLRLQSHVLKQLPLPDEFSRFVVRDSAQVPMFGLLPA
jgi:adenine-specific DNA-methyltransferase